MPLFEMSPNIQEGEAVGRKRSHDEFSDDAIKVDEASDCKVQHTGIQPSADCLLAPVRQVIHNSSPHGSPALTDAGSTPARNSPSPPTPTKSTNAPASSAITTTATSAPSKASKRKLTTAEKEARDKDLADKKKEREEKAAAKAAENAIKTAEKAAEKAKQEEEKAARAKEREDQKKKKEEEQKMKNEQRDEKKRKKEEEQQRIQEEKDKKLRSQPKLISFFKAPDTPKKADGDASTKVESPQKLDSASLRAQKSQYEKMFQPFFLKDNATLAKLGPQMDQETQEAKSRILDECIAGSRKDAAGPLNPVELFAFPSLPPRRGKLHHPVKHIMETAYKDVEKKGSGGAEASQARLQLAKVPMKVIAFSQDVRPPYYGTMTFKPFALGKTHMYRLARRSTGRRLPLDYDYDSEAEWQEEEGEDVDVDDDDEELDDEDDMDEFLDDSEDAGLLGRTFANAMEPESTGICYENLERLGPNPTVYEHKMEIMLENLDQNGGIDPFSNQYWEPEVKPSKPAKTQPAAGVKSVKMAPPPAPTDAFAALKAGVVTASTKLVKDEILDDVKKAILENKELSKLGIIDVVFAKFRDTASRMEVKNTLELVAEKKKGTGKRKEWELKAGHEISAA